MSKAPAPLFKSAEGEAKYNAAYDAALALWGVKYECLKVPTRFGSTHVIASGLEDAPPLVLLHGIAISSTCWHPNIAGLSYDFRIFAVDVIGDAGRSVPSNTPKNRSEHGEWLIDVFNELHIAQAHLAGLSYGGFLTLNFALHAPERVRRMVLLSPAASIARFRLGFWLRMLAKMVLPTRPNRAAFNNTVRSISVRSDSPEDPVFEQMFLNFCFGRFRVKVWPVVFKDEELRRVSVPTLLLIGDREIIYDPRAAVERATRLIPRIKAEIIPKAGHFVSFDQPESVDARILAFLRQSGNGDSAMGGAR